MATAAKPGNAVAQSPLFKPMAATSLTVDGDPATDDDWPAGTAGTSDAIDVDETAFDDVAISRCCRLLADNDQEIAR